MANKTSAKDALEGVGVGGTGGSGGAAAVPFIATLILMIIVGIVLALLWPIWRRRQLRLLYHSSPRGRLNVGKAPAEIDAPHEPEPTSTESPP